MITKEEYRALREAIGTRQLVGQQLGVSESTIFRREKGELPIDGEAELSLRRLHAERAKAGVK